MNDLVARCTSLGIMTRAFAPADADIERATRSQIVVTLVDHIGDSAFQRMLLTLQDLNRLKRLVVDEAHVTFSWSAFRQPLGQLDRIRANLSSQRDGGRGVPIIALSATVPPRFEQKVASALGIVGELPVVRSTAWRSNIRYTADVVGGGDDEIDVATADDAVIRRVAALVTDELNKVGRDGRLLVFCGQRHDCSLVQLLVGESQCGIYHAGLSDDNRKKALLAWSNGTIRVLACTKAFGMGVDISNIRHVIHPLTSMWKADACTTFNDYLQEAGRCGRDGLFAQATIVTNHHLVDMLSESDGDTRLFGQYLRAEKDRQCRRFYQQLFLHGLAGHMCSMTPATVFCDVCLPEANGTLTSHGNTGVADLAPFVADNRDTVVCNHDDVWRALAASRDAANVLQHTQMSVLEFWRSSGGSLEKNLWSKVISKSSVLDELPVRLVDDYSTFMPAAVDDNLGSVTSGLPSERGGTRTTQSSHDHRAEELDRNLISPRTPPKWGEAAKRVKGMAFDDVCLPS